MSVVGSKGNGWVQCAGHGTAVEMRLQGRRCSLNVTPVTAGLAAIIEAWTKEYRPDYPDLVAGLPFIEESQDASGVLRLDPRSSQRRDKNNRVM